MKQIIIGVGVLLGLGFAIGIAVGFTQAADAQTVYVEKQVVKEVDVAAPVLDRIAKCESGGQHYRDGQVVFNANTNKTVDVGKYQINTVWFKKATELGLDITKEQDNYAMARWIYLNRGTSDWSASQKCWQK